MLVRCDSQDLKLPWWGRRVILIQCHLAHPSVWPWNPGICSLLLLGFVRWQAKTLMGGPWSTLSRAALCYIVLCFAGTRGCHMCFAKAFKDPGKGGQALAEATLFVEVALRRGGSSMSQRTCWGPLCRPPAEPPVWPSARKEQLYCWGQGLPRFTVRLHAIAEAWVKGPNPRWTLNRSGSHLHAGNKGVKNSLCVCVCTLIARKSTRLTLLRNIKGFVSVEIWIKIWPFNVAFISRSHFKHIKLIH